ncbi:hypothetical protein EDB92DRAFT_742671 [Lactarius akahatsu]|uniref:Uncharacterized protein n=1 Tax=Lactarius akahatsu TaxID=416441 RepID=A0AAD4LP06_9AGAM|nr:hypothetical protein EDB92DRAFT_742671 [Lactarius akahatsu]
MFSQTTHCVSRGILATSHGIVGGGGRCMCRCAGRRSSSCLPLSLLPSRKRSGQQLVTPCLPGCPNPQFRFISPVNTDSVVGFAVWRVACLSFPQLQHAEDVSWRTKSMRQAVAVYLRPSFRLTQVSPICLTTAVRCVFERYGCPVGDRPHSGSQAFVALREWLAGRACQAENE